MKQNDFVADRLFKARTVIICEEVEQKMAKRVCSELLALADENEKDILFFINSQGGHVEAADSIHDLIQFIRPRVKVIGTGWVASAGTHIYLAAEKKDRFCLPNTRFLIHQPKGGVGGQASDIQIQAEQILKMKERLAKIIVTATGQKMNRVMKDIERDHWLTTQEAIEYGICNQVIKSINEIAG